MSRGEGVRVSELAAAAGVPLATVKFYLREGLLMPGEATSRTRSEYGEPHLERLRLVRALVETGGLGLREVHSVVAALDDPPSSRHELLGIAHAALPPPVASAEHAAPGTEPDDGAEVRAWLDELGWGEHQPPALVASLVRALADVRAAGLRLTAEDLAGYAAAARRAAVTDLRVAGRATTPAEALHTVVVGTVLVDEVLATLRRLAQQAESMARSGHTDASREDGSPATSSQE